MKIAVIIGTRPEIIKLSELLHLLEKEGRAELALIHTGQHYSYLLNKKFLDELRLPEIDFNLEIGSGAQAEQTGKMLVALGSLFDKIKPEIVVAEGDTNSVLAAALAAVKMGIPFAHVEAGIRSFDRGMPEEVNRILADQLASFCFAPTRIAVSNLRKSEALPAAIHLTGNTIVEATERNLSLARKSAVLEENSLRRGNYCVVTMHRAENTDSRQKLSEVFNAFAKIPQTIVFPMHPRTACRLKELGMWGQIKKIKNLRVIEPLGYTDFLRLCADSRIVFTDSGGIQEEVTIYKKPCIILRKNTERPEIVGSFGILAGCNEKRIIKAYNKIEKNYAALIKKLKKRKSPFGEGSASRRILDILMKNAKKQC